MKKLLYLATFVSIIGFVYLDAAQRDLTVEYTIQKLTTPDSEKFHTKSVRMPSGDTITMRTPYTTNFSIRVSSDEPLEALQQWGNYYHVWITGNTQGTMRLTPFFLKDLHLEIAASSYEVNDQPFAEALVTLLHNNYVSTFNEQTFYDIQPDTWQDGLYNLVVHKAQQVLEEQQQQIFALHRASEEIDKIVAAMSPEEQDQFFKEVAEHGRTKETDSSDTFPARTWLGKLWERAKNFFESW
jgi:hypothetical protein